MLNECNVENGKILLLGIIWLFTANLKLMKCPGEIGNVFYNKFSSSSQEQAAKEFTKLTLEEHNQSHYREVSQ